VLDRHWCLPASVPGRVGLSRLALRATARHAAAALTARLMRPGIGSPSTNGKSGLGKPAGGMARPDRAVLMDRALQALVRDQVHKIFLCLPLALLNALTDALATVKVHSTTL
jgi:hypothetical protein